MDGVKLYRPVRCHWNFFSSFQHLPPLPVHRSMTGLSMTESFGRYDSSVPTAQSPIGMLALMPYIIRSSWYSQVGAAAKVFGSRMATRNDGNLS